MKTIKVLFNHEDSGFCRTAFHAFGEAKPRYYNRHDDGGWYTVYPSSGYWESDTYIKDIVFQIVNKKGDVLFEEGHGKLASFTPVGQYVQKKANTYAKEHGLESYERWAKHMTFCPEYEAYIKDSGYRDNWLHYETEEIESKVLGSFPYLDFVYEITEIKMKHNITGWEFFYYVMKDPDTSYWGLCGYKLINDGDESALVDKTGMKIKRMVLQFSDLSEIIKKND